MFNFFKYIISKDINISLFPTFKIVLLFVIIKKYRNPWLEWTILTDFFNEHSEVTSKKRRLLTKLFESVKKH